MSFEPSHYFFPPNQEEIYYPNLDSLNEDALVSSQDTIISESFDFSTSESPTKESEISEVCKNNANKLKQEAKHNLETIIKNIHYANDRIINDVNEQYNFYILLFTLSFIH
ncbi:hypothetical protein F8M41_007521 [Gigaspora margarita]|uniref:Uncharacterized protein n=1 Tax=Gigaspora margarita TaxID=4874 RepID=A0A8H4AW75_GIGMA|nr:hypothetical protein F8M41_007521 [Gigaspora margarita]